MDLLIISAIFLIYLFNPQKNCIIFENLTQHIIFILLRGGEEESIL